MILGMGVDWTQVLVVGVPSTLAAIFSGVAVLIASLNHRSLRTSNGTTIAATVEHTHELASATADAVAEINGTTAKP